MNNYLDWSEAPNVCERLESVPVVLEHQVDDDAGGGPGHVTRDHRDT